MEDSFIFRVKVPDFKYRLKLWLNENKMLQCNLFKCLTISYLNNQCLEIYYVV